MGRGVLEFKNAVLRHLAVPGLILLIGVGSGFAQSGPPPSPDQSGKPPAASSADAAKENQHKTDEFVEATQTLNGPAGNPECVWLGRRVVVLMYRDDLDTAFRHLDLYDRFGCPGGHVQAAFRCLPRFFSLVYPQVPGSLSSRGPACRLNPTPQPQPAAPPPPAATTTSRSA